MGKATQHSLNGLELVFHANGRDIETPGDAAMLVVHWKMVMHGFRCIAVGVEEPPDQALVGSEILQSGWSTDKDCYTFLYTKEESDDSSPVPKYQMFILKGLRVDEVLSVNLYCKSSGTIRSTSVNLCSELPSSPVKLRNFHEITSAPAISDRLDDELMKLVNDQKPTIISKTSGPPSKSPQSATGGSSLQVHPDSPTRRGPQPHHPEWGPLHEPPYGPGSLGRSDLDPLGGFHGPNAGMLMDPRGMRPPMPLYPGNLPPGAVPPGARFDPYRPPGAFPPFPDPDHEPPPGWEDQFM
ncbi:unnamed protein product [Cyprideis torosa]|uniref:Proteasome inhibitor PI31 subunit n=1 Tax=Cyprideis torosa TaxID=163714 RepID=A0A7R8WBA9_9CRUS|nr:unnamed protein product [Cyprideis torosa]CAG0892126.1 unnamed protein product [Cyprideis torosa]